MNRNRVLQLLLILTVIGLGLASRMLPGLPLCVTLYVGDALWALTAFLGIGFLFPRLSILAVGLMALAFAFAIEFSQLYQAPWINALRRTIPGGLILGFGFLWSDLVCYVVGVGTGVAGELGYRQWATSPKASAIEEQQVHE